MGTQRLLAVLCAACLALTGCHESADTTVANSAEVPATDGGTRQVLLPPTGDVTLTLTEGALAADTTVTLEVVDRPVPADLGIVSKVVRIGPTGTQLQHAATLSFANFLATLPAGTDPAALALAFLRDDGLLEAIQSSPFFAGIVGSIDHFGDVVLVELQPRTVSVAEEECPVVGSITKTIDVTVGSQVPGIAVPVGNLVELTADFGELSAAAVTAAGEPGAVLEITSDTPGQARVTATVVGTSIANFAIVPLTAPRVEAAIVRMETTLGDFELQMLPTEAPRHVANFLGYVDLGFYDGTIIHRAIPNFVIQGGGFEPGMVRKTPCAPIESEADNRLQNVRGTLSLALSGSPPNRNSGNSQFFINLADNAHLDGDFTVYGAVVSGMEVVDAISNVPTAGDAPIDDVVVTRARIVE